MNKGNYQTKLTKNGYSWVNIALIIITLWISTTTTIQAFKCPKMSQTELFLHIPKSCILDFESCKK